MSELAPVTLTKFTILAGIDKVTRKISASVNKTTNDVIASVSLGVGRSPMLSLVGDQISIDGVVSGPHLTGPQGPQGIQGLSGADGVGEKGDTGATGAKGDPGDQRVFVQDTQPNFNGLTGIWLQTGIEDNGFTIWFEDGE